MQFNLDLSRLYKYWVLAQSPGQNIYRCIHYLHTFITIKRNMIIANEQKNVCIHLNQNNLSPNYMYFTSSALAYDRIGSRQPFKCVH